MPVIENVLRLGLRHKGLATSGPSEHAAVAAFEWLRCPQTFLATPSYAMRDRVDRLLRDFTRRTFYIQHSYYWGRGGSLTTTKTEPSAKPLPMHLALKNALLEWRSQSLYAAETDFVFPSLRKKGKKPLDLGAVLNRMIKPAFMKVGMWA